VAELPEQFAATSAVSVKAPTRASTRDASHRAVQTAARGISRRLRPKYPPAPRAPTIAIRIKVAHHAGARGFF
jgi:hypothetical protein